MGSKPKRKKQKRKKFLFFPSLGGEGEGESTMRALTPYKPRKRRSKNVDSRLKISGMTEGVSLYVKGGIK